MERAEVYRRLIAEQVPRVLGMLDRERLSPTHGCCDRTFWAWKFVDFPRSRFQEAVCVLAFLWSTELAGNPLFRSAATLRWIEAALRYWARLQHRDGSFDEAYPFERSLAATAFTTFYAAEALELLGERAPQDTRALVAATVERAGRWLCANDETHGFLSNHLAAAAAALEHAHRLTGVAAFAERRRHFTGKILARQSREGWYEEYGGADPGYQTHGSFYLARLAELTGDEELGASLDRATEFLAHCVHPDGSLGGEYGSRNTQTYYPAAFEMTAARSSAAAWIAERLRPSVPTAAAAGLRGACPYNYFPFLNNLTFAWRAAVDERPRRMPLEPSADRALVWFPDAGIARVRRKWYAAWVGTSKGGVVKVFHTAKGELLWSDCGFAGRLAGGGIAASSVLDRARPAQVSAEAIEVSGSFYEVSRPVLDPLRFALFRLFSITLGRAPALARWTKDLLVRVLVRRKRELDLRFRRVVRFEERAVVVEDRLEGAGARGVRELAREAHLTTIHMGSSRYFVEHELAAGRAEGPAEPPLDPEAVARGVDLVRRIPAG